MEDSSAAAPAEVIPEAGYGYAFPGDGVAATAMMIDLQQRSVVIHVAMTVSPSTVVLIRGARSSFARSAIRRSTCRPS